jgi:hypothetical protein
VAAAAAPTATATAARDTTRLEPLVCFYYTNFFSRST